MAGRVSQHLTSRPWGFNWAEEWKGHEKLEHLQRI